MRGLSIAAVSEIVLSAGLKRSQSPVRAVAAPVWPPQSSTRPAPAPFVRRVAVCPPLAGFMTAPIAAQDLATGSQIASVLRGVPELKPPAISTLPSDISVAVCEDLAPMAPPQFSLSLVAMLYICTLAVGALPAPVTPPEIRRLPSGRSVIAWLCRAVKATAPASGSKEARARTNKGRTFLKFI